MKKSIFLKIFGVSLLFINSYLPAQVGINNDGSQPDASAILDVSSTSKGLLVPRMTQSQISAITSPSNGLVVYCTTDDKLYLYVASANIWKELLYGSGTIATFPSLTTATVTDITQTTAVSGGNVTADGGSAVTVRGVCWSTLASPTIADSRTFDGNGNGIFVSVLSGLMANTTYYLRAYATNGVGTAYGNQVYFLTSATVSTVTTTNVSNISQTSATCGGNVISDGGSTVTARGVCWNTNTNPTTSDNKTTDGSGTGSFVSILTGLTANTLYYARAYATNSVGTSYGNQESFATSASLYIGQNYGGGIIFYLDETGQHGLIAAPSDQSPAEWGCYGTFIGTSTSIGSGQANTTAIVNGCGTAGIAARICDNLVLNGYNDWFLPSKDELNQMYLHHIDIGGFANFTYWSSSEDSADNVWCQVFGYGFQNIYGKPNIWFVRAVRAF